MQIIMSNQFNSKQPLIGVSDLGLATAIALYHPLEFIDRANPRKAVFVFRKEKSVKETISKYWNGQLNVNALEYFNQLKSIKTRLYSELEKI